MSRWERMTEAQKAASNARVSKWQKAHPEKKRAQLQAWRKRNPDKVRAQSRKEYVADPEKFRKRARERALLYPEATLEMRRKTWLKRYGLSESDYHAMLAAQGGTCAVCGSADPGSFRVFVVDHCHETGRVRGLLCSTCNSGIGMLKDDPKILARAISYLTENAA